MSFLQYFTIYASQKPILMVKVALERSLAKLSFSVNILFGNKAKAISAKLWMPWKSSDKVTRKSQEHPEKALRKSWESLEKVLRKSWESHEKVMRNSCESLFILLDWEVRRIWAIFAYKQTNKQPPKYKAIQISNVGLEGQWKYGVWQ